MQKWSWITKVENKILCKTSKCHPHSVEKQKKKRMRHNRFENKRRQYYLLQIFAPIQKKTRSVPFFALCARLWIRFMSQINHLLLPIDHRNCENSSLLLLSQFKYQKPKNQLTNIKRIDTHSTIIINNISISHFPFSQRKND